MWTSYSTSFLLRRHSAFTPRPLHRWIRAERTDLREGTRRSYANTWTHQIEPTLGNVKLSRLSNTQVRSWYAALSPDAPRAKSKAYAFLRTLCRAAVARGLITKSPVSVDDKNAGKSTLRRDLRLLTPRELDKLAAAMPERLRLTVTLAGWCGLRYGEIMGLQRQDVDVDTGVIRIRRAVTYPIGGPTVGEPKTAAGVRDVYYPNNIRKLLFSHLSDHTEPGPEGRLFTTGGGGYFYPTDFHGHYRKAKKVTETKNVTFHDLRHTAAVLTAQAGATTAELMERLGHSTFAASMRYQHVAKNRQKQLAKKLASMAG